MKTTLLALLGAGALASAQSVTTVIPAPAGTELSAEPITISGSFDGEGFLYDRDSVVCQGQSETGRADTIFILEDGASIANVIIGPNQAEGIHCLGSCTITNVWFTKVCEDAITIAGDGTALVTGGGAFGADDKIIQVNGIAASLTVENWYAEDFGKVVRSCGNCDGNGGPRHITLNNVVAVDGGVLCGINTNYGDTCTVVDSCHSDGKSCDRYEGNDTGDEPEKIGSGPDGEYCVVTNLSEDC